MTEYCLFRANYRNIKQQIIKTVVQDLGPIQSVFKNNEPDVIISNNKTQYVCNVCFNGSSTKILIDEKLYQSLKTTHNILIVERLMADNSTPVGFRHDIKQSDMLVCGISPDGANIIRWCIFKLDGCYNFDNRNPVNFENIYTQPLSNEEYGYLTKIDNMFANLENTKNNNVRKHYLTML